VGSTRPRNTARGVGSVDDALFEAGSLDQVDFIHVGQPEIFSGLGSPDNGPDEDHDVPENCEDPKSVRLIGVSVGLTDQPVEESERGNRLAGCIDYKRLLET